MAYTLRTLVFLTLSLAVLFTASNAYAQSNEEQLTAIFTEIIGKQKEAAKHSDKIELILDGELVVEPVDDFYAVTMPHMKLQYKDGDVLDIGIVSINASAHTSEGQWKMSVAVPATMTMQDPEGQPLMRINIGSQKTVGIWDEELDTFAKLDAAYSGITAESSDPEFKMSIPTIEIRHDFERDANGRWSGPYFITAKDLALDIKENQASIKLAEFKARFDIDRYNADETGDFKNAMVELADTESESSKEQSAALINKAIDALLGAGNGFTSNYTASGLEIEYMDKSGEKSSIKMDNANFGTDLIGMLDNNVSLAFRVGYNNFKIDAQRDDYAGFDPTNAKIDIKLTSLPIKDVLYIGRNALSSIATNPDTAAMAGLSLMLKVPAILSQAKTNLQIRDNYISSEEYKVTLDGDVIADMSAVNSATAKAQAKFFGLDKILAKAQLLADDPDNKHADKFKEIKRKLLLLKSLGKVETAEDSNFVHVFDFIMNAQGQMLLNDKDIRTIGQAAPAPSIEEIEAAQP